MMKTSGIPATYALIAISVILFILSIAQDPRAIAGSTITPLHVDLDLFEPAVADGEIWRLVTSGFMHFGIIHLGFNMWILYQLGRMLELSLGSIKFVLLYFASLLAGSLGVVLISSPNSITAGASGAVFGLMGAAAVAEWRRGVNLFASRLGSLIMLNLLLTFAISGISIGGHLGGLAGGALCGFFAVSPDRPRFSNVVQYGALVAVIVGCFAASIYLINPSLVGGG